MFRLDRHSSCGWGAILMLRSKQRAILSHYRDVLCDQVLRGKGKLATSL